VIGQPTPGELPLEAFKMKMRKHVNPFIGKARESAEAVFIFHELFIYGTTYYVTNSFHKNVPKIATG
jgi:hypothetical protein